MREILILVAETVVFVGLLAVLYASLLLLAR